MFKKKINVNPCPFCGGKVNAIKDSKWVTFQCRDCLNLNWFPKKDAIENWNDYTNNWIKNIRKETIYVYTYNQALKFAANNNYNNFQKGPSEQIIIKDNFAFIIYGNCNQNGILQVYMFKENNFSKDTFKFIDECFDSDNFLFVFDSKHGLINSGFKFNGIIKDSLENILTDALAYCFKKKAEEAKAYFSKETNNETIAIVNATKLKEFEKILEKNCKEGE